MGAAWGVDAVLKGKRTRQMYHVLINGDSMVWGLSTTTGKIKGKPVAQEVPLCLGNAPVRKAAFSIDSLGLSGQAPTWGFVRTWFPLVT